ncbi:MAG: UDP-N-acetylmuramoyl-L-alanyl-D-glutamate--2,6-diaminopimelate ligase [Planctomycetaceae bacterium]|nr:UDP-N-acetylmuramoyl-L-alanyl-D-glutamate--2,6-diaminopimelate ligase [Planctomycetaceae bacterium]
MKLSTILEGLSVCRTDGSDPDIWSIVEDSRKVREGALFIARSGTKSDGAAFLADALGRGAAAVVCAAGTARPAALPSSVAWVECEDPALVAALAGERFHGNPSSALELVGVTGTNGKTTIAYLTQQLFSAAGTRCGLVGTVEIDDGARRVPSALTTPPALELSELFARMLENGCRAAAMEVSSHSLAQHRVAALRFRTGIFTNLTGDHLDYHGTMERYADAKATLFRMLDESGTAVINIDDPWHKAMLPPRAKLLTTSVLDPKADCHATIHRMGLDAMDVTFRGPWGLLELRLPLVGRHNAMNALQAAAAAWSRGVDGERLGRALATCQAPPGRLQPVQVGGAGFSVLVDYAHSDDALANVLRALRPTLPEGGRLRVVFGCGGDRDRTKRPRMAKVACEGADEVIVTSDNPRTEDPDAIIAEILTGVPGDAHGRVQVEADRARAIALAVSTAREGDIVLIAGKGHEDYQIIGSEKRSFDDRREAEAALKVRMAT